MEKKYRVDSFVETEKKLKNLVTKVSKTTTSYHYYADDVIQGVVKLVCRNNKNEIHILDEINGKFVLSRSIPVENKEAGLKWLRSNGYTTTTVIKMTHTDYKYKNGFIGLYVINGKLKSVILDFPAGQHKEIESLLGLPSDAVIKIPYNKYLEEFR